MRKSWKLGAVSVALVAALGLFGCSGGDTTEQKADEPAAPQTETQTPEAAEPESEAVELQIFAANSLSKAMAEAEELYTQQNPNVTFADTQYEASGTLNEMLGAGQYADILITASKGTMDDAAENGYVKEDTRQTMFNNDLVIVTKEGGDLAGRDISLEDIAAGKYTLAVGDENVPADDGRRLHRARRGHRCRCHGQGRRVFCDPAAEGDSRRQGGRRVQVRRVR